MASLTAAYELTQHEGWQERYEVTVYQLGWRLGGKTSTGRGPCDRIEEVGIHILQGWYDNAFRLLRSAYAELDRIYRANIPVVPLMYRPFQFYEFNASNWENFPTEENPYAPPMWGGAGIQWLFKIKKVGT